jgi:HCOMODA/2-hydroxy-3-carboxy-muconic semialdehyde decarboxylase
VRDPADPDRFWISRAIAPGGVVASDMQVFDLDGKQLGGAPGEAYSERFIHARVYKARPDVKSVVHAHTRSIVTMSVSGLPLKPVNSGAEFAGAVVPMLDGAAIHDIPGGDKLVGVLKNGGAAIMQGHGVVVVGPSIQSAVGRSVGLDANAQMLIAILQMHGKPVYITPAADAAAQPGNYGREWDWWKRQAGVE